MLVADTLFWEEQWQESVDNSPVRNRELNFGTGKMDRWNKMAKDFAGRADSDKSTARRRETISDLCVRGILTKESTVLDIGAGPGTWALPLAEHCRHVTALEPAHAMADIMNSRILENGVDNITVHQSTWQAAELDVLGWHKAFDLVFASMTPGIDGPSQLKKMIAASRRYCYLSSFAEPGWQIQYAPLWEKFFNESMGKMSYDIIFPFNLVYAMGFHPSLSIFKWAGENVIDRKEAVRMFTRYFENYMEITRETQAAITEYIDSHSKDGRYIRPADIRIGAMIWQVGHRTD